MWHSCFLVNFVKFLKIPYLQNTSGWLLLSFIRCDFDRFSYQPEDLLRMHSTTDFSWYCTASYLSKKGFHHQPLYSKAYKLAVNGIFKMLCTVTITNISFSVVLNSDNEFNSSSMLVIHSNNLLKIYNIIRTITLINPVS